MVGNGLAFGRLGWLVWLRSDAVDLGCLLGRSLRLLSFRFSRWLFCLLGCRDLRLRFLFLIGLRTGLEENSFAIQHYPFGHCNAAPGTCGLRWVVAFGVIVGIQRLCYFDVRLAFVPHLLQLRPVESNPIRCIALCACSHRFSFLAGNPFWLPAI